MTPVNHRRYLDPVLDAVPGIPDAERTQIRIGSLAPDFGVAADDAHAALALPGALEELVHSLASRKEPFPGAGFLVRSHYGDLAGLHCMAVAHGVPPQATFAEIVRLASFLAQVAAGILVVEPTTDLAVLPSPARSVFQAGSLAAGDLFGTSDPAAIPPRAAGALVHMVEDFFTTSHVRMGEGGAAVEFHFYGDQDEARHAAADDARADDAAELQARIGKVLARYLARRARVDDLFQVHDRAVPSGGGSCARERSGRDPTSSADPA